MKKSDFGGVDELARKRMVSKMLKQNEQNALDALKRAVLATNHELYQFEINLAENYIKEALRDSGVLVEVE